MKLLYNTFLNPLETYDTVILRWAVQIQDYGIELLLALKKQISGETLWETYCNMDFWVANSVGK